MTTDAEIEARAPKWSDRVSIPAQPILLKLVEIVREHTAKRRLVGPKWKFRLAPDLVMQIQPHLPGISKRGGWAQRHELSFEGLAYQGDEVDVTTFATPRDTRFLGFRIDKNWVFRGSSIGPVPHPHQDIRVWHPEYPRPLTAEQREEFIAEERERWAADQAARDAIFSPLRDRVLDAFERGFFAHLRAGQLLGSHCMCCGRALTDPVSRARFIGPECFGSSSVDIPWMLDLQPPPDDVAFARLGLASTATQDEVVAAFRRLAKTAHPDAGGDATAFIALVEAKDRALTRTAVDQAAAA